jgi:hypothetical protein
MAAAGCGGAALMWPLLMRAGRRRCGRAELKAQIGKRLGTPPPSFILSLKMSNPRRLAIFDLDGNDDDEEEGEKSAEEGGGVDAMDTD